MEKESTQHTTIAFIQPCSKTNRVVCTSEKQQRRLVPLLHH